MQPWIYNPFKGRLENLEGYKVNWNCIQSSTSLCIEHAFRVVERRWRIIVRKAYVPLQHMSDIVATCIILYSMRTMRKINI